MPFPTESLQVAKQRIISFSLSKIKYRAECVLSLKVRLRVTLDSPLANELSGSDGLEDSREAEEESELCSILNKSVLNEGKCQSKAG